MRKRVGIGGLLLWKHSYALHTVVMPSCCGMFVYRVVTSIDTKMKMMFSGTIVFSMKLIKSVESLRYESCSLPIGWSRLSTNDDMRSVETSLFFFVLSSPAILNIQQCILDHLLLRAVGYSPQLFGVINHQLAYKTS